MDARRRKLLFRADHRGFKEMDLIMGHFARRLLPDMSDAELDRFEQLLDAPDQDVYGWIIGRTRVPGGYESSVMDKLRTFDVAAILQDKS